MASLQRLNISHVRNIGEATIQPSPAINILHGANGSGKTSVLEAVHLLACGRSFRGVKIEPVIQHDKPSCTIFADLRGDIKMGLTRFRNQRHELKLHGTRQSNWEQVARLLPVQVLDSNAFALLEGGPRVRRSFLDWGVFHVERSFVQNWRATRKCLANRNLLLKEGGDRSQIAAWDTELCRAATAVDAARQAYFDEYLPVLSEVVGQLVDLPDLSLRYHRGWEGNPLDEVLLRHAASDSKYGATQYGPHRADIVVKSGKLAAVEILSRGQQKLLVSAMKIAQGKLLSSAVNQDCIFLIDDLPSELDQANRHKVCNLLQALKSQLFLTCVDPSSLQDCWDEKVKFAKFHVEHGKITA
ncbi:MAG: DNA replication/repair protein RecF [Pseudohongiellaceae bacterium]